jgi:DNA repair protein RadC
MKVYNSTIKEISLKNFKGEIQKVKITSSKDMAQYFRTIFDEETLEVCEQVMVVFVNNNMNTIAWYKASQGGLSGTIIDVRLMFKAALECYATGIMLCHNHPSGKLVPSDVDKAITNKIKEAGRFLDIKIIDHIILTTESYLSFSDEGLL